MSTRNQGKWLEEEVSRILGDYRAKGLLDLSKVEPPTKVLWVPANRRKPGQPAQTVIMLENPFLDYVGTWPERAGRAVFLEAKSTDEPRLGILQDGGLRTAQVDALRRWSRSGAAVGVLWGHQEQIRFVPLAAVEAQLAQGVKHIKWQHARELARGMGWVTWDFLAALRLYFPHSAT